ncbi:putative Late nodulin [Medicago truncatula]|nr:unknown [Medicago truncatula]RHN44127.1 putative Late nodulin [Medicago truncatula]
MQRAKKMVETLKFIYVMILFVSIFLVMIVCDFSNLHIHVPCLTDKDCPWAKNYVLKCRKGYCVF